MSSSPPQSTNDLLRDTLPPPKIGVVICSQRQPRIGDQIGTFIFQSLKQHQQQQQASQHKSPDAQRPFELSLIDLADHPLPFFDEPGIPQRITNPQDYTHEHTRAWSRLITSYKAFVFVTPQYNWGYPANLKNAIDYLFNEWVGKPAMVVSYGGHGGTQCAGQLKQVLSGVRMKVVQKSVGLAFPGPGREFLVRAAMGEDLGLDAAGGGLWANEAGEVKVVFDELVKLLHDE
ncbi:hypothetical protein AYO21_10891 [Fonsecaea monophora]|uniref:NADPH-dependent FMN reductase-like domain-containing protein n=1 Tax=Fonsecaea monophora TaxID=254056 RepID=A0A177EUH5_9EURO|nr:hypothetical protein AYO21_10891 [Fonsecaea monophora]KAH0835185.1 NAD(P)H-dependent FMN reductase LOT6 [Fonsecaea pedrosoi]OAG34940.1 hypothetical protein AYO21_10891 [Fonsecaea monophora]